MVTELGPVPYNTIERERKEACRRKIKVDKLCNKSPLAIVKESYPDYA